MATSKIHDKSPDCVKSELDVFALPTTQTSREKTINVEIPPTGAITHDGPIEFNIPGSGDLYIEPSSINLRMVVQLVKGDASTLNLADSDVAPVNYLMHSLFSGVEVSLNGRTISYMDALYPYRAILECLTSYSEEASKTHLQNALFFKDTAGAMEVADPKIPNPFDLVWGFDEKPLAYTEVLYDNDGSESADQYRQYGNQGLHLRWLYSRESQTFELQGKLHVDICQQEKLLINNVDMRIKLTRSKPSFYLMSKSGTPDFRIRIMEASLFVDKVKVSDHVYLSQQNVLMKANAVYPIAYTTMKSISIPRGNTMGPQDTIFLGQIPTHMIIAFVDNDAYSGSYVKNPFNFKNFELEKIVARVNGEQFPAKPIECKYSNDNKCGGIFSRAFNQLFVGTNRMQGNQAGIISRKDFSRGYTIYCFDLRGDVGCEGHFELRKTGTVQLDIKFGTDLPGTVSMLVYAKFDNFIEIDYKRDIMMPN